MAILGTGRMFSGLNLTSKSSLQMRNLPNLLQIGTYNYIISSAAVGFSLFLIFGSALELGAGLRA